MSENVEVEKTIIALKKLGIGEDEARIYSLTVSLGSCTVGEISRFIDISRAKIYKVYDKLQSMGWVKAISDNPRTFIPTDPQEILSEKRESMVNAYDTALESLTPIYERSKQRFSEILVLHGSETYRKVGKMLKNAEKEIAIMTSFLPTETMTGIMDALICSKEKGVKIKIIVSKKLEKMWFIDKLKENFEVRSGDLPDAGYLIIDKKEMLIGSANKDGSTILMKDLSGIWTKEEELVKFSVVMFDQLFVENKNHPDS